MGERLREIRLVALRRRCSTGTRVIVFFHNFEPQRASRARPNNVYTVIYYYVGMRLAVFEHGKRVRSRRCSNFVPLRRVFIIIHALHRVFLKFFFVICVFSRFVLA